MVFLLYLVEMNFNQENGSSALTSAKDSGLNVYRLFQNADRYHDPRRCGNLTVYRGSPIGFFGIRDWAYLKSGILEFKVRRERDAGLLL